MPVEWNELQLLWPPDMFRREADALRHGPLNEETAGWLLDEAFYGGRALQMYRERVQLQRPIRVAAVAQQIAAARSGEQPAPYVAPHNELFQAIVDAAEQFPKWERKKLYSERRTPSSPVSWSVADLKVEVVRALRDMDANGYFEDAFGSRCPDSRDDPDSDGQRLLSDDLGIHDEVLWPLSYSPDEFSSIEDEWGHDLFFDLVEALHDRVARPRRRYWHEFHHEHDFDTFSRSSGQAVYRWRINTLFDRSDVGLRLADSGPDTGLLVETTGDARDELIEQVRGRGEPQVVDRIEHAVAQFRQRNGTREVKREATRALADVLEQRKALIKAELLNSDSNALFEIANRFDIRHMNEQQKSSYNPAFLDWVFWWYLATIDLTNRLIESPDSLE